MQIDFATIHDARAILRQLVECNPNPLREIDSTEWLDELTRIETPMAKTTTQRVIDYRERQKKIGIRGMFVYIKDTDRDSLEQIALRLNLTLGECVSYLLSEYQRNQTNG
jgi:hypothetical protein